MPCLTLFKRFAPIAAAPKAVICDISIAASTPPFLASFLIAVLVLDPNIDSSSSANIERVNTSSSKLPPYLLAVYSSLPIAVNRLALFSVLFN